MSKDIKNKNIDINDVNFVPVKPAKTYKVPYVADPIEFMVYGDRSLDSFTTEVKKMEAELRRELYHTPQAGYPIDEVEESNTNKKDKKRKTVKNIQGQKTIKGSSIIALILGLLTIVMLIIGKWLKIDEVPTLFTMVAGFDAYSYVASALQTLSTTSMEWTGFIIPCCIILLAVSSIVLMFNGALNISSNGTSIFIKIISVLNFIFAIAILVMLLAVDKILINDINYGLWIVIGLTFIVFVATIISKRKPKAKKLED